MKKQPDKFDRMMRDWNAQKAATPFVNLLRQYHQEVVKLVKQQRVVPERGNSWDHGYNEAVDDLLGELKDLAK